MTCLRGFLPIVVLSALAESPKSGYTLMKHIHERVGVKPSSGSIYPLLDHLKTQGIITSKTRGRSTEYAITKTGKEQLAAIEQKRDERLTKIIESMKMLSTITGENMTFPIGMITALKSGTLPFKEINPEWEHVRKTLFTTLQNNTLAKNAPRVKSILRETHRKLKTL